MRITMRNSLTIVIATVVLLGLTQGVAQAYTVTHSTQGVLFQDDMESVFGAEIGSWAGPASAIMKTGATVGGPAEARVGNYYLELARGPSGEYYKEAIMTQAVSSGQLHIEFSYWIDNNLVSVVVLDDAQGTNPGTGATTAAYIGYPYYATDEHWRAEMHGGASTGAPPLPGQWNLFEMDVDLDAHEYLISVNGVPGTTITGVPDVPISRVVTKLETIGRKIYMDAPAPGQLIKPGDANSDGTVNEIDASILADNWLFTSANWSHGDFNDDDIVNGIDATLMATNWQGSVAVNVPEPGTFVMLASILALLGITLSTRRR